MLTFESFYENKMDELVFENRNKNYGAYAIRRSYNNTMGRALFYALSIVALFVGTFTAINNFFPDAAIEKLKVKLEPNTRTIIVDVRNLKKEFIVNVKQKRSVLPDKPNADLTKKNLPPVVKNDIPHDLDPNKQDVPKGAQQDSTGTSDNVPDNSAGVNNNDKGEGENKKPVYNGMADVNPQFPGGEKALMKFLQSNLRYPPIAFENQTQGTVHVQFIIDTNGDVADVKVIRPIADGCTEEAIRVVSIMPKWTPGILNKQPVKVIYTLPVRFVLK